MKEKYVWLIVSLLIFLGVAAVTWNIMQGGPVPGLNQVTTICIAENSVFYGTEWCSFCQKQKELFGDSAELLNIIDCDEDKDVCVAAEIAVFPTWDIKRERYTGVQSLEKLRELTGC